MSCASIRSVFVYRSSPLRWISAGLTTQEFRPIARKGREHVLSEVNLMMICYHLRRMMTILGTEDLKKRLRTLFPVFPHSFGLKRSDLRPFFKRSTLLQAA